MLNKDVRHLLGQQVPQHAAPHAGQRTHKDQQEEGGLGRTGEGQLHSDDSESPQTQGVHPEQQQIIPPLVVHQHLAYMPGEKHRRGHQGHHGGGGVLKGHGGSQPQNEVADYPSAGGGGQPKDTHPEEVHILF